MDSGIKFLIDMLALIDEFNDLLQCVSVDWTQIVDVDVVSPRLQVRCSFGPSRAHCCHHPFKNFCRAGIA